MSRTQDVILNIIVAPFVAATTATAGYFICGGFIAKSTGLDLELPIQLSNSGRSKTPSGIARVLCRGAGFAFLAL